MLIICYQVLQLVGAVQAAGKGKKRRGVKELKERSLKLWEEPWMCWTDLFHPTYFGEMYHYYLSTSCSNLCFWTQMYLCFIFLFPLLADLLLGTADEYRFLTGGSIPVPGQSDSENFIQTMDSMDIMGFTPDERLSKRGW